MGTITRSWRRSAGALVAAGALLAAACGGESADEDDRTGDDGANGDAEQREEQPEPAHTEEQAAVVAVAQEFYLAIDEGEGQRACDLLVDSMQRFYAEEAADCASAIEGIHDELGDTRLSTIRFDAEDVVVDGDEATLSAADIAETNATDPDNVDGFEFVNADGDWLISYIS
ncbi:hypothetical protein [Haloechinothrix sp. LS1_15]|uniref:hypothetical protein n=1 Tax=Haloechinothrix sp. LS1_15 TaxID=2652248 RepID=UPI002948402C|nr:hypothetical protein [Haloechinothrix sp. LS1_15]MDV6011181.1 hypothetical protein [Haloechinothrix sp. LS1_15]